jgi:hypothetical protein
VIDPATEALGRESERNGCGSASLLRWKTFLLCLFALILPGLARAQDALRIENIGLGNYYSHDEPTAVRVHIPAASHAQVVELEFIVHSGSSPWYREISRTDRFTEHVETTAGQPLEIEAPIMIPEANWRELQVTASTADGRAIGSVSRDLKDLTALERGPFLVAVYCTDDATCRNVQSQVAFGANDRSSSNMNRDLRLTTFRDAHAESWAYQAARTVVLAGPISGFSSGERQALENFTRGGGRLVVLEQETADKDFLAAYREGAPAPVAIQVGRGYLFRVRNVASEDLGRMFGRGVAGQTWSEAAKVPAEPSADRFLKRIGVAFAFPRLRWLTIWLAIYLLVVGPLNFAILRRIRRLEWGWVSVCVLAVLFTVGFYLSGSARRPKSYTVDNATIYSLDDRSPMAVEYISLRASAPERSVVRISVNDSVLVAPAAGFQYSQGDAEEGADIGAAMTDKARIQKGWDVELGTPVIITTPMLRWSFQDWNFQGFHRFPGTVHWTGSNKLKNETGISFSEAVYFDFTENKEYAFSGVAAGQEIDLAGVTASAIWKKTKMSNDPSQEGFTLATAHNEGPFSLTDLPSWDNRFPTTGHMFAGLSDEPIAGVEMQPAGTRRAAKAVTVVYLSEK